MLAGSGNRTVIAGWVFCYRSFATVFGEGVELKKEDRSANHPASRGQGVTLRQAALIAGFAMLIMGGVPFAELYVLPKLVVPGDTEATVQNIVANKGIYVAGMLTYLNTFVGDVVVAWALYILLVPVNRSVSLLASWFRLIYTAVALVGMLKLATVFRLVSAPDFQASFGADQLQAQVQVLLSSFRYEWSLSLVLFGIHLGLVGYLIYRSGYIPRTLGILLAIAGLGYLTYYLKPYLYPDAGLDWLMVTFFGELVFMFWLLIRGWRISEPAERA